MSTLQTMKHKQPARMPGIRAQAKLPLFCACGGPLSAAQKANHLADTLVRLS